MRSQRERLRLRFFPTSLGVTASKSLHPLQLAVMQEARRTPGVTQTEVARRLNVTRQSLHYHIDQLRNAGLLGVGIQGRESRLAVTPEVAARLGTCPQCKTPYVLNANAGLLVRCSVCASLLPGRAQT